MDYNKIRAPFLSGETIRKKADLFRQRYWDNSVPVEIEEIIELKLRLQIVSIPELQRLCDTDALITSNWSLVYVDNGKYLDDRYKNRLRFSFAHEIGHFILHKDIYNNFKIKSLEDFYKMIEQISQEQYSYFETQANKFANYLLIPRERLIAEKNKLIKIKDGLKETIDSRKTDKKTVDSYMANPMAKIFGVSEEAAEIALNDINGAQ